MGAVLATLTLIPLGVLALRRAPHTISEGTSGRSVIPADERTAVATWPDGPRQQFIHRSTEETVTITMLVNAYAAPSATEPLVPTTIERRDVGPNDVLIDIATPASATPTSTPSAATGARSPTRRSSATRSSASSPRSAPRSRKHAVGDRVGVGCMVNSCRECENCLAGEEQYCLKGNTRTYASVDRRRHDHPGRLLARTSSSTRTSC